MEYFKEHPKYITFKIALLCIVIYYIFSIYNTNMQVQMYRNKRYLYKVLMLGFVL